MRLSFLNIGTEIGCLEFFEKLEILYLQHNFLDRIGPYAFRFNSNLQILNLSNNTISKVEGLSHLRKLSFIDLSHNKIKSIEPEKEFPPNVQYLRLIGNPVESEDPEYRKKVVVSL